MSCSLAIRAASDRGKVPGRALSCQHDIVKMMAGMPINTAGGKKIVMVKCWLLSSRRRDIFSRIMRIGAGSLLKLAHGALPGVVRIVNRRAQVGR